MEWLFSGKTKKKENKDAASLDNQPVFLQDEFVRQCIADADFRQLTALPSAIDPNEWLATNTVGFVEHLNLLCGVLSEYCSASTCPSMLVPGNAAVSWFDDKGKKMKCSAVQYMNFALTYSHNCCSDESIFPTKYDKNFPSTFMIILKKIFRSLLTVLAHIYHCHHGQLVLLQLNGHLNTITHHFTTFAKTFQLVEEKDLTSIADLVAKLQHFHIYRRKELKLVTCYHYEVDHRKENQDERCPRSDIVEEDKENVKQPPEDCTFATITI